MTLFCINCYLESIPPKTPFPHCSSVERKKTSHPLQCSWPQNKHQEESSLPLSTNCVLGSSLGFRSNAGLSGSFPDFQPQCMFDPLQARPSSLCEHLSQALRLHGCSLPCAALGVTPHEAVPLVDEAFRAPLHKTSHSPNQSVAQLLSHLFNMAKPHFSPEWGQNGRDSPSPNVYDWRIPDSLGRGLQRQTGVQSLDRRVPLLAHKLPWAESCLPGTDSLSPLSHGVSCDCQDGQHGGSISYKPPGGFTVLNRHARHLLLWTQDKFLPLRAIHVPGALNLAADFVETEAQVRGMDVEPSNSSPDLGLIQQSRSWPLCVTIAALVLLEFPGTSRHRCACSPLAGQEAVRVSASQAASGSPAQGEGERCPSRTRSPVLAIPDVVLWADSSSISAPLGDSDQVEPALSASGQDLAPLTQDLEAVGMAIGFDL